MSDPYRNTGYYPPQQPYGHQAYGSSGHNPQQHEQQLTQHHSSYYDNRTPSAHSSSHYPSSQLPYASPTGPGAYADSRDYNYYEDEKKPKKDHSTEKGIGATLVGGGAGAFLGHELGGGALGTVGGMIAGAVGANALERKHEKHKRERSNSAHSSHSRHGSSYGGSIPGSGLLGKFLHPDRASSRDGRSDRSSSRDRSRDRDGGSDGEGRHRHKHHHHHHHHHGDGTRSRSIGGDGYERY